MARYSVALLVLCLSVGSHGTTTKPQQQETAASKDLCEKAMIGYGFPGIPGSNGMPGMPGIPGPQGPQGREGTKGQIGNKGAQGMMGPKGDRGTEGLHGKSGPPGMPGIPGPQGPQGREGAKGQIGNKGAQGIMGPKGDGGPEGPRGLPGMTGMKGERGVMGHHGRKGDKGEKGESVEGSPASGVPQTNWKQCVWNGEYGIDDGKIKDCSFNKLQSDTALKVSFQGIMCVQGSGIKCNRWFFKFNSTECSGPLTIEAVVYNNWSANFWLLHHRSFEGYCENIPQGAVTVALWVGKCASYTLGNAVTGWIAASRIIVEEVARPQS